MNDKERLKLHDGEDRVNDVVKGDSPEPPERYNADNSQANEPDAIGGRVSMRIDPEFESTRKLANASKIMAVVSLLIGGVLLSSAALITSVIAYRKAARLPGPGQVASIDDQSIMMLKRAARASIVVSILALALNAVALVYLAPMLMQAMEAGDYTSFLGPSQQIDPSGSTFWG